MGICGVVDRNIADSSERIVSDTFAYYTWHGWNTVSGLL